MSSFVTRLPGLLFVAVIGTACERTPFCGNGIKQGTEFCDDGNNIDNDGCNTHCAPPECGNNLVDANEDCDDGNAIDGDGCSPLCRAESCGDGVVQAPEECDDSNIVNGDGCDSLCLNEFCGDGAINNGGLEQCDDGNQNSDTTPNTCRTDCTNPSCGDGVVDTGEGCDDGNNSNADACRNNCSLPSCGDGVVAAGEGCDDGNNQSGDGCSAACIDETCGDGVVNDGVLEQCDDGNAVAGDGCRADCTIEACGDNILDSNETCDDGNTVDSDGCSILCIVEFCGDSIPNNIDEECDDGNAIDNDECRNDCTSPVCGDGNVSSDEGCDDGNTVSGDGCTGDCSRLEVCGDGFVDVGEECDGPAADDGCDANCVFEPLPLRIVAGNITSGNFQNYDLGHGIRIFQGLDPDVVMIQEFNFGNGSDAAIRGFVDTTFGAEFSFFREGTVSNGDIPNGVISRFPIIEAGEENDPQVTNRDFVWARIDLPNSTHDLWAISLHLLTDGSKRPLEADALVAFIQATIPASDYLVLGGDLNSGSRTESAIVKLGAVIVNTAPFPEDQAANNNTNAPRNKPFDWVLADADLDVLKTATIFGPFTFLSGLVFDSRLFTQSELNTSFSPVLVSDSAAPSMQHMAIVRDFIIPVE
jgi:cysteine-rich repeat protein